MQTNRLLPRPLSWFLAKLRSRDAKVAEILKKSATGPKSPPPPPVLLDKAEDLNWTAR